MKRARRFGCILIVALVVAACTSGGGSRTPIATALRTTPYALLDGGPASTLAQHAGTPVLINFFASWCAPCVAEMPDLELVHQEFGDRVVFIGFDTREKPDAGKRIVEKTGVTYQIALDPEGEIFTAFGGLGMPTTVLLRPDGSIAELHSGALDASRLRSMITRAFF